MPKVLVIEDDPEIRDMYIAFLEGKGWTVFQGATGQEGLTQARECRPDVILCDVNLPDIEGLEVVKRMRLEPTTKEIPLVLISGNRKKAEDIIAGIEGGSQGYLIKPVDVRLLHAKLEALLKIA